MQSKKMFLKVGVAVMFAVAMGIGMSTSFDISKPNGGIDLLALSTQTAQGEDCYEGMNDFWKYTSANPCSSLWGIWCGGMYCP